MADITINAHDDNTFDVTVTDDRTTRHRVTMRDDDYRRLCGGRVSPPDLVRRSFEFLLEREPNTAILDQFDLTIIGTYFPNYEQEIQRRL